MVERYPEIEPYEHGMLDVGDGNLVYWEQCGDPGGKPVVAVHGGPGTGCSPGMRRFFDPAKYRIVLFDQRQCGRSRPLATDPATDITVNTTDHLIADMELLRETLGIDRWQLFGGSWGSVLSFAYAVRHPERVSEIVQMGVAVGESSEIEWMTRGIRRLLPQEWERFRDGVPEAERDGDLSLAYSRLLESDDPAVRDRAARDWAAWEDALASLTPGGGRHEAFDDPAYRYGFARMVTWYWGNNCFLDEGVVLREAAERLAGIPTVLVQGRNDYGGVISAWELAKRWPECELHLIDGEGHSTQTAGMNGALLAATDRFADRR